SPDGRRLAAVVTHDARRQSGRLGDVVYQRVVEPAERHSVNVWDLATGALTLTLGGTGRTLAFSPDGQLLAAVHADGAVKIWASATGLEVVTFRGGALDTPSRLTFSPDGRQLVASSQRSVWSWDVSAGQESRVLPGQVGMVTAVT